MQGAALQIQKGQVVGRGFWDGSDVVLKRFGHSLGRTPGGSSHDDAGYHMQYKLYTVAVLRWLKQAFGDRFDADSQFGGVFYFFLRGMGTGNGNGVYFVSPTEIGTLEDLESEIGGRISETTAS
jgi:hypothetical protein